MTKTALELTPEERQAYQPAATIKERKRRADGQIEERWEKAHRVAEEAAKLLREEFGAEKVLLFGSLVRRPWFTAWSDIDLAVWGVPPDRFFAAVGAVTGLSSDFQIDLVDPESCSPVLRSVIERDGIAV